MKQKVRKEEEIRKIVHCDEKIREVIEQSPQTYNTILQHMKDNGTLNVVLRKRMQRLIKQNKVYKLTVPGTRFGLALFCTPESDYKILVHRIMSNTKVYYMYDFKETDKHVILENFWKLSGENWNKWYFSDSIKKIPKHQLRGECFRLWR